ncbi:Endonuclease/exonuclease/phosphatase [Suillus paluster]|uniref:Endonuclease/exonuclease/phosphatase n=1 Tax=Suillus paluster TaxID=48578 RepID=UPI001B882803|nr:Endonuclease/exonuclease/phosphatase [Suillus paluster]KAG1719621.1 Endonuclease/exonuclease/phosphatase [Suillus paluster]
MRENKIGILCLQETHLTEEHENQIENLFSRRLHVLNSSDPDRPSTSAGIAFRRAAALTVYWHNEKTITILNIYAPNNPREHSYILGNKKRLNSPDFMIGDFNITEDPLDCAPARTDNENAIEALRDIRSTLNLQDTWRITFPTKRQFTFSSSNNTLSRLDRIYSSIVHNKSLLEWKTYVSPIPTDHQMISVHFAPPGLLHIGKGRWTWPLGILSDATLINKVISLGIETQKKMEQTPHRDESTNPQSIWEMFKTKMNSMAKDTAKSHLAKIDQQIKQLTKDLNSTENIKRNRPPTKETK